MAARGEPDLQQVIDGIKGALKRQKSHFQRNIFNAHKLRDLDDTFNELMKVSETVVKGKFGSRRHRHKNEITQVYPMLYHIMVRAKNGINRRLSPRMSKLHPWKVCFDISMPQEVFDLLHKGIISRTRYGVEVVEKSSSVTITFTSLRRLRLLFNEFEDYGDFKKQLGDGKGVVKLIVDDRKHGTLKYKPKEEILQFNFHYGYWNGFGIIQH